MQSRAFYEIIRYLIFIISEISIPIKIEVLIIGLFMVPKSTLWYSRYDKI